MLFRSREDFSPICARNIRQPETDLSVQQSVILIIWNLRSIELYRGNITEYRARVRYVCGKLHSEIFVRADFIPTSKQQKVSLYNIQNLIWFWSKYDYPFSPNHISEQLVNRRMNTSSRKEHEVCNAAGCFHAS